MSKQLKVKLKPGISPATIQAVRAYLDVFSTRPHVVRYAGDSIVIELAGEREVRLLQEQFSEIIETEVKHFPH